MGWWSIIDEENPGIDWAEEAPDSEFYMGDKPADIMRIALDEIREEWKKAWGREPKEPELRACFNFCCPTQEELDSFEDE